MDFNALRARTRGAAADEEEAVTVNTRALIDKVLARYSGEWTVLRELLQNAADASATQVTVRFETIPSTTVPLPPNTTPSDLLRHTVQHHTLKRLIVSNNGQVFNENDWSRLKRIAEGNPDESKIGAFGVGFYASFADCEEPFVSSGGSAMAFYWKGNSLFTRRLQLSPAESNPETNFVLDYRDTSSAVPPLLPLAQFLASSLTFVGIENIELFLDDWKILSLSKKTAPSQDIPIPKDIEPKTSEGLMKVSKISREIAQIDGRWMQILAWLPPQQKNNRLPDRDNAPSLRTFFSRLAGPARDETKTVTAEPAAPAKDMTVESSASVFLHVNTASIKTATGPNFNQELERATKKPPPKTTKLAVLTAPYVENDTLATSSSAGDIFATVLPSRSGRIFIGFPTHQTTGLAAHISAPSVIPTVERESIDLNARYVRKWNIEMLRAAGIVCRIAFSSEMSDMRENIYRKSGNRTKIRGDDVSKFLPEAISIARNFTFHESTPNSQTGQIIEDAFWVCSKKASIEVLSTCGILPTGDVRLAPKDLSFMEGIPILPDRIVVGAKEFVEKLVEYGLLTDITVSDIKKALETSALSSKQLVEFLDWAAKQSSKGQLDRPTVSSLLNVAVANDESPDGAPTSILVLGQIEYFMNPAKIPTELPVPPTVIPFKFTKSIAKNDLESFGWQELQIVPWIKWLIEQAVHSTLPESQRMTISSIFSGQVLPVLSKHWDTLSQSSKASLVEILSSQTVIPTKLGMKKPSDAYFPTVKLFSDLPTVTGLTGVKDKVLLALGVRKTVELGLVFNRLLAGGLETEGSEEKAKWSHVELIQYLASVRDDIPSSDIQRLRSTPICPSGTAADLKSAKRYKVSELFEPRPVLRELGLPILNWPGQYRSSSVEGKFLSLLGLRTVPSVPELIQIMAYAGANGDLALRDKAIQFFLSNHHINNYAQFDYSKLTLPFLPIENKADRLSAPSQCFVDEGAALLGFDIVKRELQPHAPKFGVRIHPPMEDCVRILTQRPPSTSRDARAIFAYFAGRLSEINSTNIPRLSEANFVPIFPKSSVGEKSIGLKHTSPKNCFLGDSDVFGDIFNYVDFGNEANSFLTKCGSKYEPTKVEVAQILVKEPARISSTFRNPEKYLALLRSLAESISTLKKNKELFREMRRAPFLLASKELPTADIASKKIVPVRVEEIDELDDEEEDHGIREWQLTAAENAIIVDDYMNYNLFKNSILAAPQEEGLEDFYHSLGTPLLSSLVEEAAKHGPRASDQKSAQKLQKQIYERSRLFLHEQVPDSIKHDAKWLEKNLQVQLVSSISLRRSLKGRNVSHVEKRSAVVTQSNGHTLWITGEKPDLYQVSQALIHLLLVRPKLHSALTLEMLLKTDLLDLRARGFNVSRILRQKAAEARLAESRRQQELEEEQKKIEEQEKAWREAQEQSSRDRAARQQLPGQFPDSPESRVTTKSQTVGPVAEEETDSHRPARNLFSNISRQLGIGEGRRQLQSVLGQAPSQTARNPQAITNGEAEPPPPYTNGISGQPTSQQPVTAPHQLHENLLSAIKRTRAHNSSDVFSRGETNQVTETASYCDERPAHDLSFVADLKHGIQMFLSPLSPTDTSAFLSANSTGLSVFASLLKDVAWIFSLDPRTINIFFDPNGKTIAFNSNGSLFCNYLYFQQLHQETIRRGGQRTDAIVYWFVILCHELAHNLVADHSSSHSFYTEGFVQQYFTKVIGLVSRESVTGLGSQG